MSSPTSPERRIAAIDIGSNSCLLELGHVAGGRIQLLAHRKDAIRLGSSLSSEGVLSEAAMERGWASLARFAALLGDLPRSHVRAVATQTLREAVNRERFLARGAEILGCPIEVIDGEQEARLIYEGVAQLLPASRQPRLVVDIGGRSTELALGRGLAIYHASSLPLGSVSWALEFFADGVLSDKRLAEAEAKALRTLAPHAEQFHSRHWKHAYGASGTAGAIAKVLSSQQQRPGWITRQGLASLRWRLVQAGHISQVQLGGLREELRPIIGGGVTAMLAVFQALEIERMHVAPGALRHGVLYELAQRLWPGELRH